MPDVTDADREAAARVMHETFGWDDPANLDATFTRAFIVGRDGIAAAIAQGRKEAEAERDRLADALRSVGLSPQPFDPSGSPPCFCDPQSWMQDHPGTHAGYCLKARAVLEKTGTGETVEAERDRLRDEVGVLRNAQAHLRQQIAALQDRLGVSPDV